MITLIFALKIRSIRHNSFSANYPHSRTFSITSNLHNSNIAKSKKKIVETYLSFLLYIADIGMYYKI